MKIRNGALVDIMNTLEIYGEKKLPQKISYAITRNVEILYKEYSLYKKQLDSIFSKYNDKMELDDDGNIQIQPNGIPIVKEQFVDEFNEQILELLNIEIDVKMYSIDPDIFNYDDKGIYDAMSAMDIMNLKSILCNDEGEE